MNRATRKLGSALLLALMTGGCVDLELTNPNEQTTGSFWQTQQDAVLGVNAAYRGLEENGAYGRWLHFAYDIRSDIGYSRSPWGELANFTKTIFTNFDFEPSREIWQHQYTTIYRANQVIAYVPDIEMNTGLRDRVVGEAKFIRALMYFNLVTLYGNVPLILEPSQAADRPQQATPAQTWAQIEKDLTEAIAVLPASYSGADVGRATRGAAQALLGRAYLQQKKWAQAQQAFQQVIASGQYSLLPSYRENFTEAGDNSRETIFEVQFGGPDVLSAGSRGQNVLKMLGPCSPTGPSFCDGDVRPFFLQQFDEKTTAGGDDPRLDATVFFRGEAYKRQYAQFFGSNENRPFWIKFGTYYLDDQNWDNPINIDVMRLGGIYLLHAEAAIMAGQPAAALPSINAVRQRAGLAPLAGTPTLAQVEKEELRELGFEHERWFFLARQDFLTDPAKIATLRTRDADFASFTPCRVYLPIPISEINLNPNVKQHQCTYS